jgi:hypothetical protein
MCDYSLYTFQNRLPEEGEELILHRFTTGTLGFASVFDVSTPKASTSETRGLWAAMKDWLSAGLPRSARLSAFLPGLFYF